jgi:aspartyl-tRNA(Asn)/glutamyl-tRNA(Gln) amidotransferase subunit A
MKPTYGRVSRYGLVAFASSLDQIGPIARTVRDAALFLKAFAGHDPLDSTSANREVPDFEADLEKGVKGLRLGVPKEYFGRGLDPEVEKAVRDAIAVLERCGAKIVPVSLPHTEYGIAAYYVVAPCEASSNLARFDGIRYGYRGKSEYEERLDFVTRQGGLDRETARLNVRAAMKLSGDPPEPGLVEVYRRTRTRGFGEEVRRRIMLGTFALSSGYYEAYYRKALQVRRLIRNDFEEAWKSVDAIVGPTSPIPAFPIGEKTADPLAMYLCDVFTVTAPLAGIPALSVPCGFTGAGLPVGLQILGRDWDEASLLRIGRAYERECEWWKKGPAL